MKKLIFAFALTAFVGSMATTAYAASNGVSSEIVKDDKDKKKKKKKGCCSSSTATQGCSTGTNSTQKSCCTKKQ